MAIVIPPAVYYPPIIEEIDPNMLGFRLDIALREMDAVALWLENGCMGAPPAEVARSLRRKINTALYGPRDPRAQ